MRFNWLILGALGACGGASSSPPSMAETRSAEPFLMGDALADNDGVAQDDETDEPVVPAPVPVPVVVVPPPVVPVPTPVPVVPVPAPVPVVPVPEPGVPSPGPVVNPSPAPPAPPAPNDPLLQEMLTTQDPTEKLELQEQVLTEQVQQADQMLDDLDAIIAELRRQQGLPPKDAEAAAAPP